jgi:AraC-like DNA-binding protein
LRRAASSQDFIADPIGQFCAGRRHCVFAATPTLLGFASWGRPDVEDVRELLSLCEVGLAPTLGPYRWLVDLRGLELIEPATFGLFLEYTRKHSVSLRRNVARQAQLRPDGLVGAIVSGFSHVARLPYPDRVFGEVDSALAWLDVGPEDGIAILDQLDAVRDGARERHAVVAGLRRELEGSGPFGVDEAARRLGLSTRSFQRALRDAGTTYRMEVKTFQVRRAQGLLHGDRGLEWIAAELGFSSSQHFVTAYRHATGETPTQWRARHRGSQ